MNELMEAKSLTGLRVNIKTVEKGKQLLKDELDYAIKEVWSLKLKYISNTVCDYYKISYLELCEKNRSDEIRFPRQICHFLSKFIYSTNNQYGDIPLYFIGNYFGGKHHATVLNSYNAIKNLFMSRGCITSNKRELFKEISYFMNEFNLWNEEFKKL